MNNIHFNKLKIKSGLIVSNTPKKLKAIPII